jgi:hypothetical protein
MIFILRARAVFVDPDNGKTAKDALVTAWSWVSRIFPTGVPSVRPPRRELKRTCATSDPTKPLAFTDVKAVLAGESRVSNAQVGTETAEPYFPLGAERIQAWK